MEPEQAVMQSGRDGFAVATFSGDGAALKTECSNSFLAAFQLTSLTNKNVKKRPAAKDVVLKKHQATKKRPSAAQVDPEEESEEEDPEENSEVSDVDTVAYADAPAEVAAEDVLDDDALCLKCKLEK